MWPELFRLSVLGHEIVFHSYGFMLGWALFLAVQMAQWIAAKDGIPQAKVFRFGIIVIIAGYVCGHLHSVLTDPEVTLWSGLGFTFYASALSGFAAALPAARSLGISFLKMIDAGAPSVSLAHGVGRIGCFLYGCCYGVVSPHGICFPRESAPWSDEVKTGVIPSNAAHSLPHIPTQLIESGYELALTGFLVWFLVKKRPRQGSAWLVYLVAYGPLRVIVERFRADPGRAEILGLSTSTFVGIVTTLGALAFLLVPPLVRLRPLREETKA